jgi:hypothetical protein
MAFPPVEENKERKKYDCTARRTDVPHLADGFTLKPHPTVARSGRNFLSHKNRWFLVRTLSFEAAVTYFRFIQKIEIAGQAGQKNLKKVFAAARRALRDDNGCSDGQTTGGNHLTVAQRRPHVSPGSPGTVFRLSRNRIRSDVFQGRPLRGDADSRARGS